MQELPNQWNQWTIDSEIQSEEVYQLRKQTQEYAPFSTYLEFGKTRFINKLGLTKQSTHLQKSENRAATSGLFGLSTSYEEFTNAGNQIRENWEVESWSCVILTSTLSHILTVLAAASPSPGPGPESGQTESRD